MLILTAVRGAATSMPGQRRAPGAEEAVSADPDAAARDAASKAKAGSARLRIALLRYGARHGLPNLTSKQCRALLEGPAGREGRRRGGGTNLPKAQRRAELAAAAARRAARLEKLRRDETGKKEKDGHGTRG